MSYSVDDDLVLAVLISNTEGKPLKPVSTNTFVALDPSKISPGMWRLNDCNQRFLKLIEQLFSQPRLLLIIPKRRILQFIGSFWMNPDFHLGRCFR